MAIPPPTTLPQSSRRSRKARLGNLNMGIAKTHRIATQFVGIQLSGANLLALAVSAASVVAGTVSLVAERYPFNWPLLLVSGVIGLGLALLIEGLTLGALIRLRLANRALHQQEVIIDQEMSEALASLPIPTLTQTNAKQAMQHYRRTRRLIQQEYRHHRQQATRLPRQQRRFSLPLAVMGAACSAIAGGLFYHTILAGLGPVESLILAILFPLVVTGTFVSSEIQKDAQEEAIKEGFGGGALTETAIREETKLNSALAVHQKVLAYLEKSEAEQAIEAGARALLSEILAELRASSQHVTGHILLKEEPEDDTTRQVASPKKTDETTTEGQATSDKKPSMPATPERSGTTSFPSVLPEKDDMITESKATDDTISSRSVTSEERDMLFSGIHLTDDARRTGGQVTGSGTTRAERRSTGGVKEAEKRHSSVSDQRRDMLRSIRKDDTTLANKATGHTTATTSAKKDDTMAEDEMTDNTTGDQQSFSRSVQEQQAQELDTMTTQILAYLTQHPHAKQAEVAAALGIAIRTVQRKLAVWKRQPFDH